jgi:hypothetical protein
MHSKRAHHLRAKLTSYCTTACATKTQQTPHKQSQKVLRHSCKSCEAEERTYLCVRVIGEAQQQATLADARVTDQQ